MRAGTAAKVATPLIRCTLLAFALHGVAQTFTNRNSNMLVEPDRVFPLVTWWRVNTRVQVPGCTSDWRWCDVAVDRHCDWVHASDPSSASRR